MSLSAGNTFPEAFIAEIGPLFRGLTGHPHNACLTHDILATSACRFHGCVTPAHRAVSRAQAITPVETTRELTMTNLSVHTELLKSGATDPLAGWLLPSALVL